MSTIAERVAAGAAFLDEREPGWWQRVNLDTLDLQSPCRCILGQLAVDLVDPDAWDEEDAADWKLIVRRFGLRLHHVSEPLAGTDAELGFNAIPNAHGKRAEADYRDLTAEWKRVIEQRRAAS